LHCNVRMSFLKVCHKPWDNAYHKRNINPKDLGI
jgi:hypothetical protein